MDTTFLTENGTPAAASSANGTDPVPFVAASPALDRTAGVVVVVPTFRRPAMLRQTLASLRAQTLVRSFAVLVVENDPAGGEGIAIVSQAIEAGMTNLGVIAEARPGNVSAINAGFAAALADFGEARFIAMIDDDEQASPDWLSLMMAAAEENGADIVGGPVRSHFAHAVGPAIAHHPVFDPAPTPTGWVPLIYGSGNCLMRRTVFDLLGARPFDHRFDQLGGGDTDFFTRAMRSGFRSWWQADAVITETVPAERTRTGWIIRRGLRIGAVNRALDTKANPGAFGTAKVIAKDGAILALAPFRGLRLISTPGGLSLLAATHPMMIAVGRIASAFGLEPHQYGTGKKR